MKKLLLLSALLIFACSSDDSSETSYSLKIIEPYDRVEYNQISLPGYVLNPNGNQIQTFILDEGMSSGLDDIRLSISYFCTVGGDTYNRDVFVNFVEGYTTVVELLSVNVCGLVLDIRYEE